MVSKEKYLSFISERKPGIKRAVRAGRARQDNHLAFSAAGCNWRREVCKLKKGRWCVKISWCPHPMVCYHDITRLGLGGQVGVCASQGQMCTLLTRLGLLKKGKCDMR